MITNFDIAMQNKRLQLDAASADRLREYELYRNLYESDFAAAFPSTFSKIAKKYPFEYTTAQTLIEVNLFYAMTDFFKDMLTNQGLQINVDSACQEEWSEIERENNFLAVLKEVFIDNSRFGNGIFKVALEEGCPKIFSVCPDCWFPVFDRGNINGLSGHLLVYDLEDTVNGCPVKMKRIEKHHRGYVENELWTMKDDMFKELLDIESEMGIDVVDDFSALWNDFIVFPVKNTTESDRYFGESDYKRCKSLVEELMLTVSQNSKIINRHANPKMTGSTENLEFNPSTGKSEFPNKDFIPVGRDGVKAEYITVDLQAEAISRHINSLMQFFYILTKTPPQAYGLDIAGNMSGESLRKVFMATLAKIDDIKQVSFDHTVQKVVRCAMAFNKTPVKSVKLEWGDPLPDDYGTVVKNNVDRIACGTQSKLAAIMQLDNVDETAANAKLEQIKSEVPVSEGVEDKSTAASDDGADLG